MSVPDRKQLSIVAVCWLVHVVLGLSAVCAQAPQLEYPLYGVSYYHEYMPYERLEQDVQLMEKAGVSVVRLGESTWSSWEPREGVFEYEWMEKVIDRLHRARIKVILGTPTYSIPPWLYRKHPEVLVTRLGGEKASYGLRQNMDITNPTYLFYCERLIRNVVSHFCRHPAVIGYQIDNETKSYGTAGPNVQLGFVDYLKQRFGTPARLNEVWGLTYWGQLLNDWDEFPPRDGAVNPGYKLEWTRYEHHLVTNFLTWQANIVKEYRKPGQLIIHNFDGGIRTDRDEYEIARVLDVTGVNPYHLVQDDLDGWSIALNGDLCRSLKQKNYFVVETNAQTVGWASSSYQFPPWDGQLRLNVYGHLASGADMVAYWHWHSIHAGNEMFWKGILSHDLEPNRVYSEMSRVGRELQEVGPALVNLKKRNQVAILYSVDSFHALEAMPFNRKNGVMSNFETFEETTDYLSLLHQFHKGLYDLNVETDIVFPQTPSFESYRLLIVPPLFVASDSLVDKLVEYVRNGGNLLLTFKSGFCDEYARVRWSRMPGGFRKACGFSYQEASTLTKPVALRDDPYRVGQDNQVSVWAEMLMAEGATTLASYDHHFFGKYPAITRNRFGKGTLTYEGTVLSDGLQRKVLLELLELAGLTGPDQKLPSTVKARHGQNRMGRQVHYYLNYSGQPQTFVYTRGAGRDLIGQRRVATSQTVEVNPWDLVIVEEE
ncbi:MAG: beta-galactosidase [Acidobacteria bacterium]|nr:MAG: beta-galactosidase [Acidobacteriota bacterium]